MEARPPLLDDYRKWLHYSLNSTHPEKVYNLFKAIDTKSTSGDISCEKRTTGDKVVFAISCGSVTDGLLIDENGLDELKKYLKKNYIGTEDVDNWYKEKVQHQARAENYRSFESPDETESTIRINPHPKEIFYLNLRIVISVLVYISLIIGGYIAFLQGALGGMLLILILLLFSAVFVTTMLKGLFVGMIRGNSIRVTKDQYPEVFSIVSELAAKMDVKKMPEIYITHGPFNAFVMSFARARILMLYSMVVETALKGDYGVLRFVIAHELCHIRRRHLSIEKFLFPSRIIPFLTLAYYRACEYTCDRAGYLASPKGAIEGTLIMTTGKEIYMKFNIVRHLEDAAESSGFWTWLSEKFLTHPHMTKRLAAIREYGELVRR